MKKTVVLYNPYAVFYTMPLALIAIGSYLDAEKYNVEIIDARIEKNPIEKIKQALSNNGVCFATTVLTGAPIKDAQFISREVKALFPKIPVVWGGWHPSLFPEQTLKEPSIDVIIKGQGEITFKELLERFETQSSLEGLQGISYKNKENQVVTNPERT
ncbi:MAG: cobalamin-dependent protein, partial [Bacteroidia bacterium]|nr:cobalamin-dependent protein [Bacteroidia bacterium]